MPDDSSAIEQSEHKGVIRPSYPWKETFLISGKFISSLPEGLRDLIVYLLRRRKDDASSIIFLKTCCFVGPRATIRDCDFKGWSFEKVASRNQSRTAATRSTFAYEKNKIFVNTKYSHVRSFVVVFSLSPHEICSASFDDCTCPNSNHWVQLISFRNC